MKITDIFLAAILILCMTACTENEPKKETSDMKNEECLICGAPLEYLEQDTLMIGGHPQHTTFHRNLAIM